jgi:hypothetical protein
LRLVKEKSLELLRVEGAEGGREDGGVLRPNLSDLMASLGFIVQRVSVFTAGALAASVLDFVISSLDGMSGER